MYRFTLKKVLLTTMLSASFIGSASADHLVISDIVGSWENVVGGSSVVVSNAPGQAVDTVEWGTPVGATPPSGYTFDPVDGSYTFPVPDVFGTPVLLGTFAHINNTIGLGQAITSVDYDFSFSTNGTPVTVGTTLTYLHDETNNQCFPQPGCADDVVEVTNVIINQEIEVPGDTNGPLTYFFNLLGFSNDGGATTNTTFISPEGGTNSAGLYGVVTLVPLNVPEPGMLALLGLSLAGFGLSLRKRQKGLNKAIAA